MWRSVLLCFPIASLLLCLQRIQAQAPEDTLQLHHLLQIVDSLTTHGQCQRIAPLLPKIEALGNRLGGQWLDQALDARRRYSLCFRKKGDYQEALVIAQQQVRILEQLRPQSPILVDAYNNLGIAHYYLSEYKKARKIYEKGLQLAKKIYGLQHIEVARLYNNIGLTYNDERAIPWYEKAVSILHQTGDTTSIEVAIFTFSLANAWYATGQLRKAISGFQQTLYLLQAMDPPSIAHIALTKNNLAVAMQNLGNHVEALQHILEAKNLMEEVYGPTHPQTAYAYSNLGYFFYNEGDYSRALNYFNKALAIRRSKLGESHQLVGNLYNNIGNCYRGLKRFQDALTFTEKALQIRLQVFGPVHRETADSYHDLGAIYQELGLYERALSYYRQALEINQRVLPPSHPFLSDAWYSLGTCLIKLQRYAQAKQALQHSLQILEANFLPGHPEIVRTKGKLGLCYPNDIGQAQQWFDQALNEAGFATQVLDATKQVPPLVVLQILEDKALFLKAYFEQYPDQFSLLLQALRSFEQAISLIDQVRMRYPEPASRQALINRFFSLYEGAIDITLKLYEHTRNSKWLQQAFLFSEKSKSTLLQEAIKESDAAQFSGVPAVLIQREQHLQQEFAMLEKQRFHEYEKGKKARNSIIDSIDSRIFALKETYYALLDSMRLYYPRYYELKYQSDPISLDEVQHLLQHDELLIEYFVGKEQAIAFACTKDTAWYVRIALDFPLASWVEELRQSIQAYHPLSPDKNYFVQKYRYLSEELTNQLWKPIVALHSAQKVFIVPAGPIANLPFSALIDSMPAADAPFSHYPYLLKRHSFSYNYSATLLKKLAQRPMPTQLRLAAFAPDFSTTTDSMIPPLQYNRDEARQIAKRWHGQLYEGSQANVKEFLAHASQYQLIHLATHGQANDARGEFSYLVFQPTATDSTTFSYLLYVRDIYTLDLPAELIALSACETAIGEFQRGEGVISLARGFFYAGARSLLTTLWAIDDRSSAQLMDHFYTFLAKGKPKDEALRMAQLNALSSSSHQKAHPRYWAAYILIGSTMPLQTSWWSQWRWYIALTTLLAISLGWAYYRWQNTHQ